MGSLPPALGTGAVQYNTQVLQNKKDNQVGMERLAAPVEPCKALWWLPAPQQRAAQPALCWLQGLQLVPSLVAHSLLVLRASWDTATAEGTWLCHALS